MRAFLDDRAPELLDGFDALVLEKDTVFLFQALEHCEGDPGPLLELAHEWLAALGPHVLGSAPSLRRLELHLLRRGLLAELRTVREFRRGREDVTRVVPRGMRTTNWYGDYPFFRDRRLRIPDEVFDAREELKLIARVESCEWTGAEYRLRAYVGIHRVDRKVPKVGLWLSDGRRRVPWRRGVAAATASWPPSIRTGWRAAAPGSSRCGPRCAGSSSRTGAGTPRAAPCGGSPCRVGQEAAWTSPSSSRQ
ncbi:hypothetical protein ACFQ0B_04390 [Nonomuraea thailandensis]